MSRALLEIAANSLASALAAERGGADRIELCAALEVGGLTPSPGLLALARERLGIPIHVLIRPRAGDFLYADDEIETMRRDIRACKEASCAGVVIGVLDADGRVDVPRCRALVAAADGIDVTFHRAIDVCRDPCAALEQLIALGCNRVLTSGGAPQAAAGAARIRALIEQAAGRIAVMPGGSITADNIAALVHTTGANEFHASAKRQAASGMQFVRGLLPAMEVGAWQTDSQQVRDMQTLLRMT